MKYIKHTTTKDPFTGVDLAEKRTLFYQPEGVETQCIPEHVGNLDYDRIVAEVAAGESEIEEVDATPVPHWRDQRIAAYGSIGDQLYMIFHDAADGTTTWNDHIAAVKAAHPKD